MPLWLLKLLPTGTIFKSLFTGRGGILILLLVALIAGGFAGWKANGWRWESKQASALQALIDNHNKELEVRDDINERLRALKQEVEVKERVIEKEIIKYIQTPRASESCFDDNELRLYNGE
jgi:hypothetical protein